MASRRDVDDDPRLRWALYRHGVIAEAAEAPTEERGAILRDLATKEHLPPSGCRTRLALRTLQRWVRRFRKDGLAGLMRKPRKDRGKLRGVNEAALARAGTLRKEVSRSTRTLIDALERAGEVAKGSLRRSTMDRHLDRRGESRRMLGLWGVKRHVRLAFEHPLDFVVGDFHDGPWVRMPDGSKHRAQLEAFIDHCSRYVPETRYVLSEDSMSVRRGLQALCTAHGAPVKIYVDRGPGFQSGRFHFGCDQLDIKLCHSRPYVSEGRGVIERFNRTVKEGFEVEVRARRELLPLAELNAFWRAWLEERYHHEIHSETDEPPHDRWLRLLAKTEVRRPDPVLLDEVLRLKARSKVHAKTSTVEVCSIPFVVDTALRRRWVDVLYDPHDLSSVLVYFDGRRIQRALPQVPGEPPVPAPPPPVPLPMSVDYLALVRRDHDRRRAAELSTIRFQPMPRDDVRLTLSILVERLRVCCGRPLGDVERQETAATLAALAPVEVAIADTALKIAVATLGHGLHASQYLEALRSHVLLLRTKG